MIRPLAALLLSVALLSGCSGNSLADIGVTGKDKPTIKGVEEFSVDKTAVRVVSRGKGSTLANGDSIDVNYIVVNGRTGKEFDNSYATGSTSLFTLNDKTLKGIYAALIGQKVGSRVLVAIAPQDGFNQAVAQYDLLAEDTIVGVFDIVAIHNEAYGTAVKLPASVPRLTLKDGKPTGFTTTAGTPAKAGAAAHVAIKGPGAAIKKGETITVHYVGQLYPDGKVFDSSWGKEPLFKPIGAGQLIECWDTLLIGQTIGSRVVLTCPADVAYGKEGSPPSIPGGATLIFAVDILGAA